MRSSTLGAIGELLVSADLLRLGFQVFRNVSTIGVDLVAYRDGSFVKIEVRMSEDKIHRHNRGINPNPDCELVATVNQGEIRYQWKAKSGKWRYFASSIPFSSEIEHDLDLDIDPEDEM